MNPTKRLTGECSECGGSIQFPAELIGTMTQCPRCRKQTELALPVPPDEPAVPRKVVVWTTVAVGILVLALIATVVGLKHLEKLAARQKAPAALTAGAKDSAGAAGFEVTGISLDKGQGSNTVYVLGTVVNTAGRQRRQVSVEFYVLDAAGQKVAIARGFRPTLDSGAKWQVRLPVEVSSQALSAKLASIKEGQ